MKRIIATSVAQRKTQFMTSLSISMIWLAVTTQVK